MSNPSNADKRSVSTDALETLGTIIGPNEKRDAIHLAVDPAVAVGTLQPGWDVGFVDGGVGVCDDPVGIVDPFLTAPVQPGERFWLVVYPRQITSLRHVWSHPAFEEESPSSDIELPVDLPKGWDAEEAAKGRYEFKKELDGTNASKRWIREYAESIGLDYDELMTAADDWVESRESGEWGEYLNRGELLEGVTLPADFWTHYEKVTGAEVADEYRESFFTCSC